MLFNYSYGCIKRGCKAKLMIAPNHDEASIKLGNERHTCDPKSHKSLQETMFIKQCKEAVSVNTGSTKAVFDDLCLK